VVGLGAFQKLSSSVEEKVEQRDRKAQARAKPD
jgi:hypothetical protein